jgi:sugar/nucleoside kinase (ribokinase family)
VADDRWPRESVEQRHGVDDRDALHASGVALGERQPDRRAPAVAHERDLRHLERGEELLYESDVGGQRVSETSGLARTPEARQVGGYPAASLEECQPVVGARGDAVEIQRRGAGGRGTAIEDRRSAELDRVLVDVNPCPPPARITSPAMSAIATRTLCLGDAIVDLVGERPGRALTEIDRFSPHLGGVSANVAVVAARAGARVALVGGAGDDEWGRWLRHQLLEARVDVSLFDLIPGLETPLAFVTLDAGGEPAYHLRGELTGTFARAVAGRLDDVVRESAALFISTNTLVDAQERELTMRARTLALELERPLIFDANVRLHRWSSRTDAAATANACVRGALLVRANRVEAELMTGEEDPERAAVALVKAGARLVVLTLGAEGAILRGALRADVPGVASMVRSTAGAGDALTGTLLARLALSGFYLSSVAAALPEAVSAAAAACERWGAVD